MVVPYLPVLMALCLAGCIESHRPQFVVDSAGDVSDDTTDTEETTEDSGPDEIDVPSPQCFNSGDCPSAAAVCSEQVCLENLCIERQKAKGATCDDGDPCTGNGTCDADTCNHGSPVVDGASCDDDDLVCNGVSLCNDGRCDIALAPSCPASANPCASGTTCSEELGGVCVDVPIADGKPCDGPSSESGASAIAQWQCSAGACLPPEMVFAPAGLFTMGCPEGYCQDGNNGPAHEVRVSAFAIDRTEVSQAAFVRCRDDSDNRGFACTPRPDEAETLASDGAEDLPLRWVDWERARDVCAYQGKRLCSEAEWEYAARGSEAAYYPWGNLPLSCDRATYFSNSGAGCGSGAPTAVGSKPHGASPFGALDMAGNVSEWCADYYRRDLYQARAGTTPLDPVQSEPFEGTESHVVRGGSFREGSGPIRPFVRSGQGTAIYNDDLGVRCCLSLNGP